MLCVAEAAGLHASSTPDKPALICSGQTLSYGQLWRCAQAVARWLTEARGLSRGDRVVMAANAKDPWFAPTYLGTHLAGAVAVPLDSRISESSRQFVLNRVAPALDLAGRDLDDLRTVLVEASTASAVPQFTGAALGSEDVADIMFTSGSTGMPKGVVLTHGNIKASATNINAFIGNGAADREVVTLPLSHSFGLGRLRCNLLAGGTVILVPGLTFPAVTFDALARHRATGLASVPAGFALMLRVGGDKLAACAEHLAYIEIGSASMDHRHKRELMRLLPRTRICMHYGLTEASRSAFIEFHRDANHLDSIGRPTPNVSIVVADVAGNPLPAGETGQIRIRAATVMKEYWRDPARTAAALKDDGWLDTGDQGHFDADGYLHFEGRGDDLINVGGRKVYPLEVEVVGEAIDGVAECACVAAPDPDQLLGEVPALYLVLRDGAQLEARQVIDAMRGKLSPYAVPRLVRFVPELPRTDSGKLKRAVLRSREFSQDPAVA